MNIINKIKKIIQDFSLNIFAVNLPTIVLQLIILPLLAKIITSDNDYGLLLTIVGLITLLSSSLGNALNNVRLLKDKEYTEKNLKGDFNLIFVFFVIINTIFITISSYLYIKEFQPLIFLLIIIVSFLLLSTEYFSVTFRLNLEYRAILINSVFLTIGYIIGYFIFYISGIWLYIYLLGYLFSMVYIFYKSPLPKEPITKTPLFKSTLISCLVLFTSGFFNLSITYFDRLLLYPLVGGDAVSIYHAASLLGKFLALGVSPMSSVILSHLVKEKNNSKKTFGLVIKLSVALGIVFYTLAVFSSGFSLNLFYPMWAAEAGKYIYITTATAIVMVLCSITNPFILRFCNINWQIIINLCVLLIYILLSLLFLHFWGLLGFCIAAFATNFIKFLMLIIIYYYNSKNKN